MEDLLEDEDEDFDKDDKVIMSRQASTKKCFARKSSCARHRRGLTYRKNTHTNTQMNKMTFFPFPAVSSPLPRGTNTVHRDRTAPRNLFVLTSVFSHLLSSLFFPLSCNPFLICAYFFLPAVEFTTRTL